MKYVSPSQIKTYRLCPRRWWYSRHEPRPEDTEGQTLGKDVHEHLEDYLKFSIPIPKNTLSGRVARKMLPLLPDPKDVCNGDVERWLDVQFPNWPIPVHGRIDLVEIDDDRVTDFKTTKDWRHALTEEEMFRDPQAVMYCAGTGKLKFRHVYGRTKELKRGLDPAREVGVEYTPDQLQDLLAEMLPEVQKMLQQHDLEDHEVPKTDDTSACFRYGRCPHSSKCYAADHKAQKELLAAADEFLTLFEECK